MNKEITTPRRQALAQQMEAGHLAIVFAKPESEGIEKYTQDNNFLYFTGLEIPSAIFMQHKAANRVNEMLFIQRGIPEREVWDGKKMNPAEAKDITGIDNIYYLEDFYPTLSMYAPSTQKVWTNSGTPQINAPLPYALHMLEPLRKIYPGMQLDNVNTLVRPLRSIKSEWEVMQMQKAIDLTGKGIIAVMESAQPGMMEYELEAMLFYHMQKKGVRNWGFAPIVGTGINAATLHYKQNNSMIKENEVILMDVGASYLNYSADITRCLPSSATFTSRQRDVYAEVLGVQKDIIAMIKPGIGMTELNEQTLELIGQAMIRLNLISSVGEVRKYYMHSIGHHLGMDTHDLGARDAILEAGNIITIEPGIYIPEEKLGIRIEDDILVTETGFCVLSQYIPKEIEEIYALRENAFR